MFDHIFILYHCLGLFVSKVLVYDFSATLRHVMVKQLRLGNHEVFQASSPEEVMSMLEVNDAENLSSKIDVLVFSCTTGYKFESTNLLQCLKSGKDDKLAVLMVTVDMKDPDHEWVHKRESTGMLHIDDYQEVNDILAKLISKPDEMETRKEVEDRIPANYDISILFVDDSASMRAVIHNLLEKNGYQIAIAENPRQAIQLCQELQFDIAIIDYYMPSMNGDELCYELSKDEKTSSIMKAIYTSSYEEEIIRSCLSAGASDCMFKNESQKLFLARLEAMSRTIRIQRDVERKRKHLEGILYSVGDGVYGVDLSGNLTFINPVARHLLGVESEKSVLGLNCHDLFHYATDTGETFSKDNCFLQQAYLLGDQLENWETVFWRTDKRVIPVECTVYPLMVEGFFEGSVVAFKDFSVRKRLEEELEWRVNHDHLTKLYNRYFFDEELIGEVRRVNRSNDLTSALVFLDLDRFKYINDTAGHTAGDRMLVTVSQHLKTTLKPHDLLARLGGDEFGILLKNIDPSDIKRQVERIRRAMMQCSFTHQGRSYSIQASIGVGIIEKGVASPEEVMSNADIACYIAKKHGRNQVHIYKPEGDEKVAMSLELDWSAKLEDALENDLFILHFQPIANLNPEFSYSHKRSALNMVVVDHAVSVSHYEVLLRLDGDGTEVFPPNTFLPTAERYNMMPSIDSWIIETVFKRLSDAYKQGKGTHLAINLSAQTLKSKDVLRKIEGWLIEYEIDPSDIIFEITETAALDHLEDAQFFVSTLKAHGCLFALDDFGTGYSSFSHLKHLDVDFVKIDGMFIQDLYSSPLDQAMVRSINDISHTLGKKTIAEYIEQPEQLTMIKEFGVDYAQGFLIGIPKDHW